VDKQDQVVDKLVQVVDKQDQVVDKLVQVVDKQDQVVDKLVQVVDKQDDDVDERARSWSAPKSTSRSISVRGFKVISLHRVGLWALKRSTCGACARTSMANRSRRPSMGCYRARERLKAIIEELLKRHNLSVTS
jgi:hypothetical protein